MKTHKISSHSLMPYERKNAPLASKSKYRKRLMSSFLFASGLLSISLAIGTIGYWYFGQMNTISAKPSWIDAFLCASMILTGMGPIGVIDSDSGKIFSALYAIYSGVAFLSSIAIFFSPIIHRFLHLMHIDTEEENN